jgi:hypothetical protein
MPRTCTETATELRRGREEAAAARAGDTITAEEEGKWRSLRDAGNLESGWAGLTQDGAMMSLAGCVRLAMVAMDERAAAAAAVAVPS